MKHYLVRLSHNDIDRGSSYRVLQAYNLDHAVIKATSAHWNRDGWFTSNIEEV